LVKEDIVYYIECGLLSVVFLTWTNESILLRASSSQGFSPLI